LTNTAVLTESRPDINFAACIKKIIIMILFTVIFMPAYPAFAAPGDYGTESVFTAGAGSRADGMAGAFTAVADDLSAIHYNPAGLVNIKKQEVSLLYYPLYEAASFGSVSYGQTLLDFGTIGAGFFIFSVGGMEGYDADDNPTSSFSSGQYRAVVSYARMLTEGLSAGANANIYYSNMSRFNYAGFGLDAGILYQPFSFLRAGFTAKNIIPPSFSMQSVTETLGRTYTLGILGKYKTGDFEFSGAYDIMAGEKEGFKDRAGIEIKWAGAAGVRAGYSDGELTFGAGLYLYDFKFDYAFVSNGYFGRMDRYTLSYAFGMTLEEQKAQRRRNIYNEVRRIVEARLRIKTKEEAETYYRRAYAYYQKQEFEDALTQAEKSLEWKKDYEPSLKMKKILEDKLKEKIKSGESAALSGDNDRYISAGIELYEKKQYDEAIKQWELALKSRPGNKALASLIAKAKKDRDSGGGTVRLTREQKETADKMYYAAVNKYTEGDLKGAVEIWKKVLAINPDDVKSIRDLRKTQAELEELKRRGIE